MKPLFTVFFLLLAFHACLTGQTGSQEDKQTGSLYFSLKNIGFIRNKEYFNPASQGPLYLGTMYETNRLEWYEGFGYFNPDIEGYTLIGDFIQPSLVYYPYSKLSIRAGAHFLKYSGVGKLSEIKPVLSVKYDFSEKTSVTFGSLDGCENRKMMDPLFDFERMYINNSESGFEFISKHDHITNYTWLDWEHFIFAGDTERETINFGESFRYSSDKLFDKFNIAVPVQFLIRHRGGQISNYSERMETFMDAGAGINIDYDLNYSKGYKLGADLIHFIYYDNTPDGAILSFKQGYADWMKLHFTTKNLGVEMAWFKSHNFYAPLGNLVYSSISGFTGKTILADRSLLSCSTSLNILKLKYLEFYLGIDFYYDLNIKELYNAAALHLKFNEAVKLFSGMR
jgi:hypothetical protein